MESFHASLRAGFIDRELFYTIKEIGVMVDEWRDHYNHDGRHGSLANCSSVPKSKIENSSRTKKIISQNSH